MKVAALVSIGSFLLATCSSATRSVDEPAALDRHVVFCDRLERIPSQLAPVDDGSAMVVAFVRSREPADVAAVQSVLEHDRRVASIEFTSAEDAHHDYLSRPGVVPDGQPGVPVSAFSPSFLVTLRGFEAEEKAALVDYLESLAEVRSVTIARERPILASLSSITVLEHLLYPWQQPPGDVGLTFAAYFEVGLTGREIWQRWITELESLVEFAPEDLRERLERLVGYQRALGDTWTAFGSGDPVGVELQGRDLENRLALVGPAKSFERAIRAGCG